MLENFAANYRYIPLRSRQGTAVRDVIFREATGQFVLCVDCHVFFPAGVLARLIEYCRRNPESRDLLQGPLLDDALVPLATHFVPEWSHGMYGTWGLDARGEDRDADPFEIPMQGLGSVRLPPGNLARFQSAAGRIRRRRRIYSREDAPRGGPQSLPSVSAVDAPLRKAHGHTLQAQLGRPHPQLLAHLRRTESRPRTPGEAFRRIPGKGAGTGTVPKRASRDRRPFPFFRRHLLHQPRPADRSLARDAAPLPQTGNRGRGTPFLRRRDALEPPHRLRALPPPFIIAEAKQQHLQSILVFEDDARFSADACAVLRSSLQELAGRDGSSFISAGTYPRIRSSPSRNVRT